MSNDLTGNSGGLWSTDDNIYPGTILLGGSVGVGNVVSASIMVGATTYPFAVTAVSGDTLQSLVNAFIALINASTALAALGITANQGNPVVMAFSFLCRRNGMPIPTITASATGTITTTIASQPQNILDAGPIWYLGRTTGQPPLSGDNVGEIPFNGGHSANVNLTVSYAMIQGEVANPTLATIQGRMHINTAGVFPAGGNLCRRGTWERGLTLYDSAMVVAAGGDKGAGTINVPGGYFVNGVPVGQKSAFSATMATGQSVAGSVMTKVNFGVTGSVVGVPYDSTNDRWVPPPGMVRLSTSLLWNVPAGSYIFIYKNGAPLRGSPRGDVSALDYANGSDYYDVRVLLSAGATLDAQALYSWFEGSQV